MRTNKRLKFILSGCVASMILAFLVWPREREPEYKGVPLSEWLKGYENLRGNLWVMPANKLDAISESISAVRHIGTNALPFLIRWIQYEQPGWRWSVVRVAWKLPPAIRDSRAGSWLLADRAEDRADRAVAGFAFLGTNATPVLPELQHLAKNANKPQTAYRAESALRFLTPDIPIGELIDPGDP